MPLLIYSLRGGHTHTHKQTHTLQCLTGKCDNNNNNTHTYRHSQTEAILRNQPSNGLCQRAPGLETSIGQ